VVCVAVHLFLWGLKAPLPPSKSRAVCTTLNVHPCSHYENSFYSVLSPNCISQLPLSDDTAADNHTLLSSALVICQFYRQNWMRAGGRSCSESVPRKLWHRSSAGWQQRRPTSVASNCRTFSWRPNSAPRSGALSWRPSHPR